jgi:DNA primase
LLEAGKGLRFAVLPAGLDPDDLIKQQGAPAMQKVLDAAQPMVRLLWQRETDGRDFDSPERKAALDKTLRAAISRIADPSIRAHYGEEIKALRWELFGAGRRNNASQRPGQPWQKNAKGRFQPPPAGPVPGTRTSILATSAAPEDALREAVILATCLRFPSLIPRFETALERLDLTSDDHTRLRNLLLTHAGSDACVDLIRADSPGALDRLTANPHVRIAPALQPRADAEFAATCLAEALAHLQADRAHRAELADATEDVGHLVDEGLTWRLTKATEARATAARGPQDQKGEAIIASNGVELDREELDRARRLHAQIDFTRGGKSRH